MFTAEGNMKNVADIVEELDRVLGPMSDEMKAATLDQLGLNRGVADAVKILSGTTEQIREYEEALRGAGGTTQEIADKQLDSLQAQLDILNDRFIELKLGIIETNEDGISVLIDGLGRLIDKTGNGITAFQLFLKSFKEVETQFGGVLGLLIRTVKVQDIYNQKVEEQFQNTDEQNRQFDILLYNLQNLDATLGTVEEQYAEQARTQAYALRGSVEFTEQIQEEKEAEEELAKTRMEKSIGSLNKVFNAYKKILNIQENIQDLQKDEKDALKNLNKARENLTQSETEADKALEELNRQKELSKQVTLEEQLAIERQRESVKRLEEQEERSKLQNLELQVAKERLTELINASTEATNEEERAQSNYQQALDNVAREQEKVRKAQEEYRESQENLAKATANSTENLLAMAVAKKELDDAIADAEAIGALEEGIRQMVQSVGGDLETLKNQFQSIFDLKGKNISSFTGGGTPSSGGSEKFGTDGSLLDSGSDTASKLAKPDRFAFTAGQQGGVTTITNIKVAVEGALTDKQNIQDAVAIAVIEAQKRGTKVIL